MLERFHSNIAAIAYLESPEPLLLLDEVDLDIGNFLKVIAIQSVDQTDSKEKVSIVRHGDWITKPVANRHSL